METYVAIGTDIKTDKVVTIGSDARARSTYVIGITGTGKSTLLETMAYLDMGNGAGLCFLDPHGDSIKKLLASVPTNREQDVIFWNPADIEKPFGLNPFYCFDPDNELMVSETAENFISALKSLKEFAPIFESGAPQMTDLLENLAYTFIINQGHTLAETTKFLTVQDYREQFYRKLTGNFARYRTYWEEFDALRPDDQEHRRASSLNKLRRFQTDPILYGIFGQPENSINFRKAMDRRQIILVDLSRDHQGILGAFIVWEIMQAARSRTELPESERTPFHLFSDEFQTYMTTAFPTLQAEARKFGVDTVVAHQVQKQLDTEIQEITRAVGNVIIFRVVYPNAASLAGEFDTTPVPGEPVLKPVTQRRVDIPEQYSRQWTSPEAEVENKKLAKHVTDLLSQADLLITAFGRTTNFGFNQHSIRSLEFFYSVEPNNWRFDLETLISCATNAYEGAWWYFDWEKYLDAGRTFLESFSRGKYVDRPHTEVARSRENEAIAARYLEELQDIIAVGGKQAFTDLVAWLTRKRETIMSDLDASHKRWEQVCRVYHKRVKTADAVYTEEVIRHEWVPGPPLPRHEVIAGIANELVGLPNFQAKCKISHQGDRPTEHTILTLRYPGTEDPNRSQRLAETSREKFGRSRQEIESAIKERLRIMREHSDGVEQTQSSGEEEPIIREKVARRKRIQAFIP